MLKIRLQRTGRRNDPSYRVVVTEHTRGPKSQNHVDRVGFYNPKTKEKKLNEERIKYWISVGAQASGTMHNMLIKAGIVKGKTINVLPQKTPVVKEVEEVEEKSAESKPATESPKEEDVQDEVAEDSTDEPAEASSTGDVDSNESKVDEEKAETVEDTPAEEVSEKTDETKDDGAHSTDVVEAEASPEEKNEK